MAVRSTAAAPSALRPPARPPLTRCAARTRPPRRLARAAAQVLLQTSQGDIVIDLHAELAPVACKNFVKLCKCARARRERRVCEGALR